MITSMGTPLYSHCSDMGSPTSHVYRTFKDFIESRAITASPLILQNLRMFNRPSIRVGAGIKEGSELWHSTSITMILLLK